MKNCIIEIKNLSKIFGSGDTEAKVLKGVNLKIYSGDYIILFGPSGCGKSTLMNCIAGLEVPTSGEVLVRGENLTKKNDDDLALHRRQKIGMIFQQFNILKSMTVLQNIALPQLLHGVDQKTRLNRAHSLLKILSLDKFSDRIPTELSGGQQQRVAIARALANNPWIILADEPTGNLDSKNADEVMDLIWALNKKSKRTIIMVTHNPDYLHFASRVLYMKDGIITKDATQKPSNKKNKLVIEGLEHIGGQS